jgi:hypothetical protein
MAAAGTFPVRVRYRCGEGGGSRDASFYGLCYDRSEAAVLGRLRGAHRFASHVEIVEVRWRDPRGAPPTGQSGRRGPGRGPLPAGESATTTRDGAARHRPRFGAVRPPVGTAPPGPPR